MFLVVMSMVRKRVIFSDIIAYIRQILNKLMSNISVIN